MIRYHRITYLCGSGVYTSNFTRSGDYSFFNYQREQISVGNQPPTLVKVLDLASYNYQFDSHVQARKDYDISATIRETH